MLLQASLVFVLILCRANHSTAIRKHVSDRLSYVTLLREIAFCEGQFLCECHDGNRLSCVPSWKTCDGKADCLNHADEAMCHLKIPKCLDPKITCPDGKTCAVLCDGIPDCSMAEDERDCACPDGELSIRCALKNTGILGCAKPCDGITECNNGHDEYPENEKCACPNGEDSTRCTLKTTGKIGCAKPCDGNKECSNGQDEFPDNEKCACPNGDDSIRCTLKTTGKIGCAKPCDGKTECTNGQDEFPANEKCACPNGDDSTRCTLKTTGKIGCAKPCDGNTECSNAQDEAPTNDKCVCPRVNDEAYVRCVSKDSGQIACVKACDGVNDCQNNEDEAPINKMCECDARSVRCEFTNSTLGCAPLCDKEKQCKNIDEGLLCVDGSCDSKWMKIFQHSRNGGVLYGEKTDLISAVSTGAVVKVQFLTNYFTSVENLIFIKGHICGQALFHISKRGSFNFQNNAYWWFVNICTNGKVNFDRYFVGKHDRNGVTNTRVAATWFVRHKCNPKPELQITADGTAVTGSVTNIVNAVKNGWDVRVMESTTGYIFPADNLVFSTNEQEVAAQSVWHVSQISSGDAMVFQSNAYWWFTIWSTIARRSMSRWLVGQHTTRGSNDVDVPSKWFVDSCWKHIYTHDATGQNLSGSLEDLVAAVEAGHRVKLLIDRESIEPSMIVMRNGVINAVLLDSVSKQGLNAFPSSVYWFWRIASSSGSVKTIRYFVGNTNSIPRFTNQFKMSWFIDDRSWQRVLSVSNTGQVQSGSKQSLENAVKNGASVRLIKDISGGYVVLEVDNLAIDSGGDIGAMNVRALGFELDGESEINFPASPYWDFTITKTDGSIQVSRWTVGEYTNRGREPQSANIQWFVC